MKTIIVSALLGLCGAAVVAQELPPAEPAQPSIMAPAEPAKPAVETPAAPAQPAVETPAQPPAEIPSKPAVETPAPLVQPAVTPQPPVEIPAKPAVEIPAVPAQPVAETPAVAPQPEVKAAPAPASLAELRKSHGQAVADLKKKQEELVKQLKVSMKGKPIPEIRAAVEKQRTGDRAELKALKNVQNAEIEQFKKDHPQAVKKMQEIKKQEPQTPAVPEKK